MKIIFLNTFNFILIPLLAISFSVNAQTEPSKSRQPTKQAQKKVEVSKPTPIDNVKTAPQKPPLIKFSMEMLERGRIDPGYMGFSISDVIESIEKMAVSKKGEFESTAEYNARKAAALTQRLSGDWSLQDTFAFLVPVSQGVGYRDGLRYVFNADTSEVRLFVLPKQRVLNGIGAPDYQTNRRQSIGLDQFDLDFKVDSQSTYEASNAYGAKVTVERTISTRLGIAVNQIPFLNLTRDSYQNPVPAIQFNLENARASKELPALKALVVLNLSDPYAVYDFFSSKPSRDNPKDMSSQSKFLHGNVLGIVFYSGLSGEILARIPDAFGMPESKVETKPDVK